MGKRKQRVRWCVVDGLKWSNNEDESSPEGSVSGKVTGSYSSTSGPGSYNVGPGRRSSQSWVHNGVAPRFEKRSQGGNRQVYYDGEYCDAEEMPNGFTKIRSKNLDILFKREYYEQKLCPPRPKDPDQTFVVTQEEVLPSDAESRDDLEHQPSEAVESKPFKTSKSLDEIDPSEIREFRPMNSVTETDSEQLTSGEQSPYYPPYYDQQQTQNGGYNYNPAPPRPNLYLYSPSNNTLIPCEEIVIPNPVMGSEGPVYAGPTNIYLAYPVSGPDGRGYITQPFSPPLPHDYVSYPSYSPSISLDGSQYQSSTPQTPNSGQDSGSSTQPTSPPPLVNYHPANWFQPNNSEPDVCKENEEPLAKERTNSTPRNETPTVQYIPGLTIDSTPKKSQKKKKKKKPVHGGGGQRDSLSSESEIYRIYGSVEKSEPTLSGPLNPYGSSQVVEVNLTDSLADNMVNPPTDPECSDEETIQNTEETNPAVTAEETIAGLPRDDTICNLEELASEETLELEPSQPETESLGSENLIDSGIEKDLEEILTSEPDTKKENQSSSESVESFDLHAAVEEQPAADVATEDIVAHDNNIPTDNFVTEMNDNVIEVEPCVVEPSVVQDLPADDVPAVDAAEEDVPAEAELPAADQPQPQEDEHEPEPQQDQVLPKPKKKRTKKKRTEESCPQVLASIAATASKAAVAATASTADETQQNIPTEPEPPKLSYSAICRTREATNPTPAARPPQPQTRDLISSQPKSEGSEAQPRPESVPTLNHTEETPSTSNAGEWETVPASITSKPGEWEKKKDKKRRKKKNTVNFQETPEVLEIPESVERESSVPPLETVRLPSPPTQMRDATPEEEGDNEVESEVEEKKNKKKKKKKHSSEEPEEKGHKVLICDNQIEIQFSRSVRRASEVLGEEQINAVRNSGYCDILLIEKLGCGMSRGSMHLGRLYQGRYVPPDRIDGLLPIKEEDNTNQEDTQEVPVVDQSAAIVAEEIDLD